MGGGGVSLGFGTQQERAEGMHPCFIREKVKGGFRDHDTWTDENGRERTKTRAGLIGTWIASRYMVPDSLGGKDYVEGR